MAITMGKDPTNKKFKRTNNQSFFLIDKTRPKIPRGGQINTVLSPTGLIGPRLFKIS